MDVDCRQMILSEDYYDFLLYDTPPRLEKNLEAANAHCFQNLDVNYDILYISHTDVPPINYENYLYTEIPTLYGLVLDGAEQLQNGTRAGASLTTVSGSENNPDYESLKASGILDLQASRLALKGRGVLIGYLDTGIDYRNSVFRYSNGDSRIAAIWDQTIQTGTLPELFAYGSEYKRADIDLALASDTPYEIVPSRDENGHGSAMAGVQAAPEATIAMVKLKPAKQYLRDFYCVKEDAIAYSETDMLTAIKYLDHLALSLNMPLVIAIGLGTNLGDHNGNSPIAGYCDHLLQRHERAIVIAGGNEGASRHHYFGEMTVSNEINPNSTPGISSVAEYQNVEIKVGDGEKQFMIELWGGRPDIYSISVQSPGGEIIPRIPARRRLNVHYHFLYEPTTVTVDYIIGERWSGAELVMIRFLNPTPGIWTIGVYPEGSATSFPLARNVIQTFHIWLPMNGFVSEDTYFLLPNPDVTLTEPAYAVQPLTVSTYQVSNNSFYVGSGRGYSRSEKIKPDLAAPGVNVLTVGGRRTASCMAAAITAGALAQYLEWAVVQGNEPYFRMNDIKYYLYRGADRNSPLTYPNRLWGYGRLNIKGAFDTMQALF